MQKPCIFYIQWQAFLTQGNLSMKYPAEVFTQFGGECHENSAQMVNTMPLYWIREEQNPFFQFRYDTQNFASKL